jgi:hypothetical protein
MAATYSRQFCKHGRPIGGECRILAREICIANKKSVPHSLFVSKNFQSSIIQIKVSSSKFHCEFTTSEVKTRQIFKNTTYMIIQQEFRFIIQLLFVNVFVV